MCVHRFRIWEEPSITVMAQWENQQQEELLGVTSGESQDQASNIPLSE